MSDRATISSEERLTLVTAVSTAGQNLREHLNGLTAAIPSPWWVQVTAWFRQTDADPRNPVRIKNLEKMLAHLHVLQHFLADPCHAVSDASRQTLSDLLKQLEKPEHLSFNNAWELTDLLEAELLHIGDADYIRGAWLTWPRSRVPDKIRDQVASKDADLSDATAGQVLETVVRPWLLEDQRDLVQEYRRDRAMIRMRQSFLTIMALALLILDIGFCWLYLLVMSPALPGTSLSTSAIKAPESAVTPSVPVTMTEFMTGTLAQDGSALKDAAATSTAPSLSLLLLIAIAGAIGSVLSRATKLTLQPLPSASGASAGKEEPLGIRTLMSARAIFGAQIVLGATAALIVYLVFDSGLLNIAQLEQQTPSTLAIIALIAGFSEPFLTQVVDRISGRVA